MKVEYHVIITSVVAGIFYYFTQSLLNSFILLCAGVVIDIDHLFDYFYYKHETKDYNYSVENLFDTCEEIRLIHAFLFFHSYEMLIIGWILYILFTPQWLLALMLGLSLHLSLDITKNPVRVIQYSLIARALSGFNARTFYKNKKFREE